MARLALAWMVVTAFALLPARTAHAAAPSDVPPSLHLALANPDEAPATAASPEAGGALPVVATLAEPEVTRPPDLSYGVAARLRWVSVPKWLLNLFTAQNVPVSSWATAFEVFRRKGDFEFAFSIGYQNMTPPDGNWLGKSNSPATDVDYVQVRGLGFLSLDVSFIWHTFVNDWFGLHYGAGLGIATIFGSVNRTSNFGCTDANAGDINACHPVGVNPANTAVTIDRQIQNLGSGPDDPNNPHRFSDPNVPGFLPIVNLVFGVDFRLPRTRGWEAKLEGGFYDAFFLGGGVGYTF